MKLADLFHVSVTDQVQVAEGVRKKSGSRSEHVGKSFGAGGKQKGLGFNSCVAPLCTQVSYFRKPIRQKRKQGGTEVDIHTGDTEGNI